MPAYNEAKLIRRALEGVPAFVDHIVVVDDASFDATTEIAKAVERPIDVIEHETNHGVGGAITTGCRHALSLGADLTAVMAADGHDGVGVAINRRGGGLREATVEPVPVLLL